MRLCHFKIKLKNASQNAVICDHLGATAGVTLSVWSYKYFDTLHFFYFFSPCVWVFFWGGGFRGGNLFCVDGAERGWGN